jgi:hypothetical protein
MTPSPHFSAMTPSPSPNVLLHSISDSSSSPIVQSMPALELVTLVDEEEQKPVSSRPRSRKKLTLLM